MLITGEKIKQRGDCKDACGQEITPGAKIVFYRPHSKSAGSKRLAPAEVLEIIPKVRETNMFVGYDSVQKQSEYVHVFTEYWRIRVQPLDTDTPINLDNLERIAVVGKA
jgi:hypothetical protein